MTKFQKYFTNLGVNVPKVLELDQFSGCSYVGQFPGARVVDESQIDFRDCAVDVFYQPNPNRELKHSNYFSIFIRNGTVYIANAEYVTQLVLHGVYDSEGDILYARYQHDFRYTFDKSFGVDGGSWIKNAVSGKWEMWGRTLGGESSIVYPKSCSIVVVGDKLIDFPYNVTPINNVPQHETL